MQLIAISYNELILKSCIYLNIIYTTVKGTMLWMCIGVCMCEDACVPYTLSCRTSGDVRCLHTLSFLPSFLK